jgi:diguanylate cyclase (GGDEF)-like protein
MQVDNLELLKGTNSNKIRGEILRQVAKLAGQYLREEDVIAYLSDDTFAFLLPDTPGENAKAIMEYLQVRVAWTPFESTNNGIKFNLGGVVGIVAYNHNGTSRDNLMAQASQALQLAEVEDDGKAFLITNNSSPEDNAHAS